MAFANRTPEQEARDNIDRSLEQAGWKVQSMKKIDFSAGLGIAVCEYQTDVGPADYVLFVDKKPVGVVEAKQEERGQNITTVEEQSAEYAVAKLKWLNNINPLPFVYESTGEITRFTDARDPKPRLPRSVQLSSSGDDAGMAFSIRIASIKIPGATESGSNGTESVPDQRH